MLKDKQTDLAKFTDFCIDYLSKIRTKKQGGEFWDRALSILKKIEPNQHLEEWSNVLEYIATGQINDTVKILNPQSPIVDHTVRKTVSEIRRGLKQAFKNKSSINERREHWLLDESGNSIKDKTGIKHGLIKVDFKLAIQNNTKKKKRAETAARSKALVTENQLNNLIEEAKTLIQSRFDIDKIILGLCLLTGRRTIEVVNTGSFKRKNRYRTKVAFSGQAKRHGIDTSYAIPVLCDSKLVIDAHKKLKKLLESEKLGDMSNEQIHSVFHNRLNAKISKKGKYKDKYRSSKIKPFIEFSEKIGREIHVHDIRKIYAAKCMHLANVKDDDQALFLRDVLGHQDIRIGTHYKTFKIID